MKVFVVGNDILGYNTLLFGDSKLLRELLKPEINITDFDNLVINNLGDLNAGNANRDYQDGAEKQD